MAAMVKGQGRGRAGAWLGQGRSAGAQTLLARVEKMLPQIAAKHALLHDASLLELGP